MCQNTRNLTNASTQKCIATWWLFWPRSRDSFDSWNHEVSASFLNNSNQKGTYQTRAPHQNRFRPEINTFIYAHIFFFSKYNLSRQPEFEAINTNRKYKYPPKRGRSVSYSSQLTDRINMSSPGLHFSIFPSFYVIYELNTAK